MALSGDRSAPAIARTAFSRFIAQEHGKKLHHPDAEPVLDARHAETAHLKGN